MERIEAYCPPPLVNDMDEFAEEQGYENRSQVVRALLRTGLTYHSTVSPGSSAPVAMEEELELELEPELDDEAQMEKVAEMDLEEESATHEDG